MIERYRELLEEVDRWFKRVAERHPGVLPCHRGCSACCHGPFDISIGDVTLIRSGLKRLAPADRAEVERRARSQMEAVHQLAPDWEPPYDIRALGEGRFDALADQLGHLPCPLLDDEGACRLYADRPLVCRLTGLGMITPEGRHLENVCPIQDQFPAYAALDPALFDLESLEDREVPLLEWAALAMSGVQEPAGFETTVAGAILGL